MHKEGLGTSESDQAEYSTHMRHGPGIPSQHRTEFMSVLKIETQSGLKIEHHAQTKNHVPRLHSQTVSVEQAAKGQAKCILQTLHETHSIQTWSLDLTIFFFFLTGSLF